MIEFMVIGLPRSGTCWAANWLTTDTTLCLHDPLFQYHYSELDSLNSEKTLGIACTGIHLFQEFVQSSKAKKVILHRPIEEVNQSLNAIGFPAIPDFDLSYIDGLHVHHTELFTNPKSIYEFLLDKEFDQERHQELAKMFVQANLAEITVNKTASNKLIRELQLSVCH